jgi:hypothetical protein
LEKNLRKGVAILAEGAIVTHMKTLQEYANMTADEMMNDMLNESHARRVVHLIDEGKTPEEAVSEADEVMFAFLTEGDITQGVEQEDFDSYEDI